MDDELDPREAERIRRQDRDAGAERRALLKPGMGKVFKQIQDAQAKAATEPRRRGAGAKPKRPKLKRPMPPTPPKPARGAQ